MHDWMLSTAIKIDDPGKKSAFTGFTAFSKTLVPSTTAFSFLSNITNQTEKLQTNGTCVASEISKSRKDISTSLVTSSNKSNFGNKEESDGKFNDYFSKLKGLNENVANWIKKHVDTNPLINLQPVFKDYEKYFKDIENENSKSILEAKNIDLKKKNENVPSLSAFVFKAAENIPDSTTGKALLDSDKNDLNKSDIKFSFGSAIPSNISIGNKPSFDFTSTTTSNTFSFESSIMSTSIMNTPSFSFGSNSSTSNIAGLNFPASKPFKISNEPPNLTEESYKVEEVEDDDEPPKMEFTAVVEKDYVFTTRCKVFVKKPDGNYGDRGVGNLYLKKIQNSNKVQLIVRADTNLGNLLCNLILSECIPIKRVGKKDVMLVCLPTADFKPPPVPILLRVKSPEEADNLVEILEKHKN